MNTVTCPQCAGEGSYLPNSRKTKTIPCGRCGESGRVDAGSESRLEAFNAWRIGMRHDEISHRLGVPRHMVFQWILGQAEIPEETAKLFVRSA